MSKSDLITIIVASIPFIITAILIFVLFMLSQKEYKERIKFWKTHNKQQEKEHKALEIIKKYKSHIAVGVLLNALTKEEYELLKEVLK